MLNRILLCLLVNCFISLYAASAFDLTSAAGPVRAFGTHPLSPSPDKRKPLDNMMLISGTANPELSAAVAEYLGKKLADGKIGRFNDGEVSIKIGDSLRGKHVFILQPTCGTPTSSVNDNLQELLMTVDMAKRASASEITAVIPYYGYARQDRKSDGHVPISASGVAIQLQAIGVKRVMVVDLHCGQIQGFFEIPVDNLLASLAFADYAEKLKGQDIVIVSPDAGGVERAKKFKEFLSRRGIETGIAMMIKERAGAGVIEKTTLVGDVKDKVAIIIDDMCDTGGTLAAASHELKGFGATDVYAFVTHGLFSKDAYAKIAASAFKEVVTTDTIPLKPGAPENIIRISIADLLARAIYEVYTGGSVTGIFESSGK